MSVEYPGFRMLLPSHFVGDLRVEGHSVHAEDDQTTEHHTFNFGPVL